MELKQKLDQKPAREVGYPTVVKTAAEEGIESLEDFMDQLEDESISYVRNELGIEDFEEPEEGLVLEDSLPLIERAGKDHLGVYRDRDDLAAIKLNASFSKPFHTAVHEMVHVDQYKRMLNLDLEGNKPQEVLAENNLAGITDYSENTEEFDDNCEGLGYTANPLLDDLVSENYLSAAEVAKAVYEDDDVANEVQRLQSKYNEVGEAKHERFVRELELVADEQESDEWDLEENEEALEVVNETYDTVVSSLDDTHGEAFYSPEMSGEMEGFAHYISAVVKGNKFDRRVRNLEDNYTTELEDGTTVGEMAAERVQELGKIHENLTEHGDMTDEQAANYVLTEVQPRKFDYRAK